MRGSVLLEELVDAADGLDAPGCEDDVEDALELPDPWGPAGSRGGELPEPPEGADVEGDGGLAPGVIGAGYLVEWIPLSQQFFFMRQ